MKFNRDDQGSVTRLIGNGSGVAIYAGGNQTFADLGVGMNYTPLGASSGNASVGAVANMGSFASLGWRDQQAVFGDIRRQNSAEVGTYYFGAIAAGVPLELAGIAALAVAPKVLNSLRAGLAAERGLLSPFTQKYLSTSGGRFGSTATREQLYEISQGYVNSGKFVKFEGGGLRSEELIRGIGPGSKGGTYVDFTARAADGRAVRVQTIDTLADGITATPREAAAAARIRAAFPNDQLILIPKAR